MKNTVFIHTNAKQIVGACVAAHALRRNSAAPERFDVRILHAEDFLYLSDHEGRSYLRDGKPQVWVNDDLQSFPPLRFAVPGLMDYSGRAIVIDPDIFAVGDINELFDTDMQGHAILARPAADGAANRWASSVMLLDCAKLTHWNGERDFERLFAFERDYRDWMWLSQEPAGSVGGLATVWNDFDRLTPDTRLLHNTRRRTQPWKTGLPAEFVSHGTSLLARTRRALRQLRQAVAPNGAPNGRYKRHPDPAQERLFFQLLSECLKLGGISREKLQREIDLGHVRRDAFALLPG